MSDEKRWRFEDRGEFPDYIWQEDEDGSEGLHIASFYIPDAAESIVADHNARLVQTPAGAPAGAPGDVRAAAERLLTHRYKHGLDDQRAQDIELVARHVLSGSRGAEGLAAALAFYADEKNYEITERYIEGTPPQVREDGRRVRLGIGPIFYEASNVSEDDGERARAALAPWSEAEGT